MNRLPQLASDPGAGRMTQTYVLVADSDLERAARAVGECMRVQDHAVMVARDGYQAVSLLGHLGAPELLVVEFGLPGNDGLAVIETLRRLEQGAATIFVWPPAAGLRELERRRLAALGGTVVTGGSLAAALRDAADHQTVRSATNKADSGESAAGGRYDADRRMRELTTAVRRVRPACGVAVYLGAEGESARASDQLRAFVTWTSEAPMPASPELLPRIAQTIMDTGDSIAWPDLASDRVTRSAAQGGVRSLIAVPVTNAAGEREGAIILFDTEPLEIRRADLDALEAIGQTSDWGPAGQGTRGELNQQPTETISASTAAAEVVQEIGEAGTATSAHRTATAIPDRETASFAVARELARARREQARLSLVILDIKSRTAGDVAPGDGVGPTAAARNALSRTSRGADLVIEWEKDHLLVMLPGLGEVEARQVAERLRASMQAGAAYRADVSGGVAEMAADEDIDSVVGRAYDRLGVAHSRGANRIA